MSKKKKIVILSCMIALLVTTAVLNFVLSSNVVGASDTATPTASYFTEVRNTRNTSRSKQLEQIDEIIASDSADESTKKEALNMKLKLSKISEQENLLESLIKSKGYGEVAVTVGLSSDNISVIVKDSEFTQDDAIIIYTICQNELNAAPENVYIQAID
jgi:stage III sporulation protein AH